VPWIPVLCTGRQRSCCRKSNVVCVSVSGTRGWALQKRINRSTCRPGSGLGWAKATTHYLVRGRDLPIGNGTFEKKITSDFLRTLSTSVPIGGLLKQTGATLNFPQWNIRPLRCGLSSKFFKHLLSATHRWRYSPSHRLRPDSRVCRRISERCGDKVRPGRDTGRSQPHCTL